MIQKLTNLIIKPKRPTYNPDKDLGPTHFSIDQKHLGVRIDFKVRNRRGHVLECSFFHRTVEGSKKYPLMLYCHGNIGNRTHSYGTVYSMLRSKINVITFDFAGCGLSEGDKISLGYYEQDDIEDVLDYAIKTFNFIDANRIGIWGRCMGAVSAILYTSRTNNISLLVLDSPFPDFVSLIRDYIQRVKIIPKWAEDYMYEKIRNKIKTQANFDFEEIKPIEKASQCTVPAYFIHGRNDRVIPSYLFKRIFDAYPGQKEFLELDTSHNGSRTDSTYETIASFVRTKFYSPTTYRRFEPTPKHSNCKTDQVILTESGVASLDTFRFNENLDNTNDDGLGAVQIAFEDIANEKNDEYKSLGDLDGDMEGTIMTHPPSKKEIKSAWKLFNHKHKKGEGKLKKLKEFFVPSLHLCHPTEENSYKQAKAEEECEVSDDLSDTGRITNRDYLEMSCIEQAAKSTFDSFRLKKNSPLTSASVSNYANL